MLRPSLHLGLLLIASLGCWTLRPGTEVRDATSDPIAASEAATDATVAPDRLDVGVEDHLDATPVDVRESDAAMDLGADIPDEFVAPDVALLDAGIDAGIDAGTDAGSAATDATDVVAAEIPAGPCGAGQARCAGVCTVTQTDRDHCGFCGMRCPAGALGCVGGRCVVPEQLAAGSSYTCARFNDGTVRCWGTNTAVAASGGGRSDQPVAVPGITDARSIAAGRSVACAALSDGTVRCWGMQPGLANGPPSPVPRITDALEVAATGHSACARLSDETLRCWGVDFEGLLGDGPGTPSMTPVSVPGLLGVVAISGGGDHICARLRDGTVRCWGWNMQGQTTGTAPRYESPSPVSGVSGAVDVVTGQSHTCARLGSGRMRCWGYNASGQIGNGVVEMMFGGVRTPTDVMGLPLVAGGCAGGNFTCAFTADGALHCWGGNDSGQLGDRSLTGRATAELVTSVTGVRSVACGSGHACAIGQDSRVTCWGAGSALVAYVPGAVTPVMGVTGARSICAGLQHACAVDGAGAVRCWGANAAGQLGDGTTALRAAPVVAAGLPPSQRVFCGGQTTCAQSMTGELRCWGSNYEGVIDPSRGDRVFMTPYVIPLTSPVQLVVAAGHSCAVNDRRGVVCWGSNSDSSLNGTRTPSGGRVELTALGLARDVAGGTGFSCAVLDDGGVRCWGERGYEVLGDGVRGTGPTPPVSVAGITDAVGIAGVGGTQRHICAVSSTGVVRCWGTGDRGQLGNGMLQNSLAPVVVSTVQTATQVAVGSAFTVALRRDGTVVFWGSDPVLTGAAPVSTPRAVAGLSNVVEVQAAGQHYCARRMDGRVVCLGNNAYGQLGTDRTDTDPVTVPFD